MIPETFPCLKPEDIIDPPAQEYEEGDRKSTIGWLKYLFLYSQCEDNPDCIQITPQDQKDFQNALDKFKKIVIIKKDESVDNWEETASRKAQAAALNKLRKSMGYTVEYYI